VAGSSRAVIPLSPCARTTAYACQEETYAAMPATASTAAAVDRRIARSMPLVGVRAGHHRAAVAAEPAADWFGELVLLVSSAYRTEIGPGETRVGHGLLLHNRLGGIWEVASDANRPEPVPTELNQSL
jgi:hypothetical protein